MAVVSRSRERGLAGQQHTPLARIMAAVMEGQELTFRVRSRQLLELAGLTLVAWLALCYYVGAVASRGPVDYGFWPLYFGLLSAPGCLIFCGLAVFLPQPGRLAVLLPGEVRTGVRSIAWTDVAAFSTVWYPWNRFVVVHRRAGKSERLGAPRGASWRRDRRFDADVAAVRDWATRHGGVAGSAAPRSRRPAVLTVVVIAALAVWLTVHCAKVGVVTPWTPTVAAAPPACDLLAVVDFKQAWPSAGQLSRPQTDDGPADYCDVSSGAEPHQRVSLDNTICSRGDMFGSPLGHAVVQFSNLRGNFERIDVPGADGAFVDVNTGHGVDVVFRKANCIMNITIQEDGTSHPDNLLEVARRVAGGVAVGLKPT